MKPVIWLIGGTSEGRRLIKELAKLPVELYVSVATDYGASLIEPQPGMTVMAERMDLAAMACLYSGASPCLRYRRYASLCYRCYRNGAGGLQHRAG